MITDADLVAIHLIGSPTQGRPLTREAGEKWMAQRRAASAWELVPVPACPCCGEPSWPNGRCTKHQGRDACAIEGCKRTAATPPGFEPGQNDYLCGEHWKRYVPPRSLIRRTYRTFFRQAKRHGWGYKGKRDDKPRLDWRYRRFWRAVIAQARRRATEGHVDEAAIRALFGWDEDGG